MLVVSTLIATLRVVVPMRCSARYTRPMPPSPIFETMRYRSAITCPISGSEGGSSGAPQPAQKRA